MRQHKAPLRFSVAVLVLSISLDEHFLENVESPRSSVCKFIKSTGLASSLCLSHDAGVLEQPAAAPRALGAVCGLPGHECQDDCRGSKGRWPGETKAWGVPPLWWRLGKWTPNEAPSEGILKGGRVLLCRGARGIPWQLLRYLGLH